VITCEVLIAGGGPAGSACAWKLRQAGIDALVIDKAAFPRDKTCAGWITPGVVRELQIDTNDYGTRRTFQPITAFRIGVIGDREVVDIAYGRPVSFGIRRCEFDEYLLRRSKARLLLGTPVARIRRDGRHWVVNDEIRASLLVGAGGHFCPVARMLNGAAVQASVVAAQEAEFVAEPRDVWPTAEERPELYFCPDLQGYGWCFRKGRYLNVGFGRFNARALPHATADFVEYLKANGRIPASGTWHWRGHAYLVSSEAPRKAVDDAVMLIGDAAGLAYPRSGEGILPAVESGSMAASTILDARGRYGLDRLTPYADRLRARFGVSRLSHLLPVAVPERALSAMARRLMHQRWFVRQLLLNRSFLHTSDLAPSPPMPQSP